MTTLDTARLLDLLDGVPYGVVAFDGDWRMLWVNSAGAALLRRPAEDLRGRVIWEEFPGSEQTLVYREYHRAVAEQREVSFELFYGPLTGWFDVAAIPTADGLVATFRNITASRRQRFLLDGSREALARIAEDAPLREVLDVLSEMVESQSTHGALASILLLDESGRHLVHGSAPSLPRDYSQAIDGVEIGPAVGSCGTAAHRGQQVIVEDIAKDPLWLDYRDLAEEAGLRACWSTPILSATGAVLGTFAIYYREPRLPEPDDREVIEQVTRTAAIAIQHDRDRSALREAAAAAQALAAATREVAHVLQESLLTLPPRVPGIEFAVRYQAAAATAEVGGDWYDAIHLPGGRVGLSIGDVVGHDLAAAAIMGQLRNLLRACACEPDQDPAQVLQRLDRLIDGLGITEFATAVYADVSRPVAGGAAVSLRWSNAGHPAPALLRPDGTVVLLDEAADLPLGIDPAAARQVHETRLELGSTLVLYTDGLVERRDEAIDVTQGELLQCLREHGSTPIEQLADLLLGVVQEQADDVALLAIRV